MDLKLSFLLAGQILKLFIMILIGYLLVKGKVLKTDDAKTLSAIVLYAAAPCAIINMFQIDFTQDKLIGLCLSFLAAIIVHLVYIPLSKIIGKPLGLMPIEKATVIYSNSGNIIIPLVSSIFGAEWVLYTSGYMVVQTILLWTHAKSLVCNEPNFDIKKIIMNINIWAILFGIILFLTHTTLPSLVGDTVSTIGSLMAPLSMMVTGMLIANMEFLSIFTTVRVYLISFLRLIVYPLIVIVIFRVLPFGMIHKDAYTILMITVLAACAPAASTITQFAQMFDKHPGYASIMNIMTTLFCILTMPIMIMIYQLL